MAISVTFNAVNFNSAIILTPPKAFLDIIPKQ